MPVNKIISGMPSGDETNLEDEPMDGFPTHIFSKRRSPFWATLLLGLSLPFLLLGLGCGDFTLFGDDDQGVCDPDPCESKANATAGTCKAVGESDYECGCDDDYFWKDDGNTCENPCDPDPCDALANAKADTCTGIDAEDFTCECDEGFVWDGGTNTCEGTPCDPDPCDGIANAVADTCTAVGADDFTCDCDEDENYFWKDEDNTCQDPCASNPCDAIDDALAGTCDGVAWNDFTCECDGDLVWDGSTNSCEVDPCDPDPCGGIPDAEPDTCLPQGADDFTCSCDDDYYWKDDGNTCEDPCDPDPCAGIANALPGTCDGTGLDEFSCDCDSGFEWDEESEQCEIQAAGTCEDLKACLGECTGISDISCALTCQATWTGCECELDVDLLIEQCTSACFFDCLDTESKACWDCVLDCGFDSQCQ